MSYPLTASLTDTSCNLTTQKFYFIQFSVSDVHKALIQLDPKKPTGPDKLEPFYLKVAADFIAEPLAYLFNLLSLRVNFQGSGRLPSFLLYLKGVTHCI